MGVIRLVLIVVIATGVPAAPAFAASAPKETNVRAGFRPSFEIKPLVQCYEAPPGKVIDFAFDAHVKGGPTRLKVQAVGMKQLETGQVEPDESAGPTANIRLIGPGEIELRADKPAQIRGRITVPNDGSSFQTYGVLVTDLGPAAPEARPEDPGQVAVGVKFITRYLLRIEVVARGVRDESARKLQVASGVLADSAGRASARLLVANPTGTQFQFEARCRLLRKGGAPLGPSFKLAMPSRTNQQDQLRHRARVLGYSRVLMVAPVPEPIMPGEYELDAELLVDGRPVARQRFPLTVTAGQFPAQAALVAQVVEDVTVSPTQVELSLRPKGRRLVPVRITNTSARPVAVRLEPRAADGAALPWAVVRPGAFELAAGMARNVLVSTRDAEKLAEHQYARLHVEVTPQDGGVGGTRDLPLALLTRAQTPARLVVGKLGWDTTEATPCFQIPVANEGLIHTPLNGTLTLADPFGRTYELRGGFDHWLMPGETSAIRFPSEHPLPPGEYTVHAIVQTGEGEGPVRMKERVRIDGTTLSNAGKE